MLLHFKTSTQKKHYTTKILNPNNRTRCCEALCCCLTVFVFVAYTVARCTDKTRTDKSFVLLVCVRLVRMFGKSLQERGKNLENYLYYSDPFFAYNNSLYIEKTINGKPVNIKLSNFLARITEDITCTNGAENERFLSIVGTDDKGKDLRKITVPLKNFAQLDWAQEYWGINCVIESGYGNRDNLRQAIQSTAKYAGREKG